jgi:hypothetical protein
VRLLVADPDQLGHLLLGQAENDAALANSQTDVAIDVQGATAPADVAADDLTG